MKRKLERIQNGLWGKKKGKDIQPKNLSDGEALFIGASFRDDLRGSTQKPGE